MSRFIDERIVEMSFDNKKFESNVKTSMGTIDDLKSSLDFSGTAKSLNKHLNGVDTGGLVSGIASVGHGFSVMEIGAIAAIVNITNRIIDLGIQMVKSLSIDQISAGWSKFAEMAVSEATLLAQGLEQAQVTETLENFLWFADETSYSLTDMTNNMAKFTAAGIDLADAEQAMMGIANWAALSGQNSQTASRAMYQLSQAMGSGVIKTMDWKSIETANMATAEFKKTVLETAVAMGTLSKDMDGAYVTLTGKTFDESQFRDFLQEGFFTSDVLTKTLGIYASAVDEVQKIMDEDMSITTAARGMEVYEKQLNELEKEYEQLTDESEKSIKMAELANKRLGLTAFRAAQEARTFGDAINAVKDAVSTGWLNIFQGIFGKVAEAKILWTDLATELVEMFMGGLYKANEVLKVWGDLGGRDDLFANTEESTGAFWNLFYAVRAVIEVFQGAWSKVFGFSQLEDYEENVTELGKKLKSFTETLKKWSEGLMLSEKSAETLTNILTGLFSILKAVGKFIGAVWKGIQPLVKVIAYFAGLIFNLLGKIGLGITDLVNTTTIFDKIANNLSKFFTAIINFVKSLELLKRVKIFIDSITESFNKTSKHAKKNGSALGGLKSVITSIGNALKWLGNIIATYIGPVLPKIFISIGSVIGWAAGKIVNFVLYVSDLIKRFWAWASVNVTIQNGLKILRNVITSLGQAFRWLWTQITGFFDFIGKNKKKTEPLEEFAEETEKTLTPLQTFLKGLGDLFKGLWSVAKAVMGAIGTLFAFIGQALSYIGDKLKSIFTDSEGAVSFKKIFTAGFWTLVAVGIIRFARILHTITNVFREAFEGVLDVFNSIAMKNYMEAIKTMAISILLMVAALLILGAMDPKKLQQGMYAIAALIGFIVAVMLILKKLIAGEAMVSFLKEGGKKFKQIKKSTNDLYGLGLAFIGLGIAILLLTTSLKILSGLDTDKVMFSLSIIAVLFAMIVGVMKFVGQAEKGTNKAVKSMVKVAISIALLSRPLKIIGGIDVWTGIKGLVGIGVLMFILGEYSKNSQSIKKSEKPILSLIKVAIALAILTIPLKVIGQMPWEQTWNALKVMFSIFASLTIMSKLLKKKDVNRLTQLGNSLWKFGIAMVMFAGAMLLMGLNSWENIDKTLNIVSIMFLVLLVMAKLLKKKDADRLTQLGNQLWKFAIAMALFAGAMLLMGLNSWSNIWKSMVAIGLVFAALTLLVKVMGKKLTQAKVRDLTKMTESLLPLAFGLAVLGVAMLVMSKIPWEHIIISLGVIFTVLGMLSLFSIVLSKFGSSPGKLALLGLALIALSVGLLALSVAMLALGSLKIDVIGKGLLAILGIFIILAAASIVLAKVLPLMLAIVGVFLMFTLGVYLLAAAITMLVALMTISSAAFAAALIGISLAIVVALPTIEKALLGLVETFYRVFKLLIKRLGSLFEELIVELFRIGTELTPRLGALLLTMGMELLRLIVKIKPMLLDVLLDLILSFLQVVLKYTPDIVETVVDIVIAITDGLKRKLPELSDAGFDLIITLIDSLGNTIDKRAGEIREAMDKFGGKIVSALLKFFGIDSNGTSKKFSEIAKDLIRGLIDGLIDGVKGIWGAVLKAGGIVVDFFKKVFGIKSPSRVFAEMGLQLDAGLAKGIKDNTDKVYDAAKVLGEDTTDGIEKSGMYDTLSKLSDSLQSDFDNEITIRPVMDLTEIQNGKNSINNLMGDIDDYSISGSNTIAKQTRDEINSGSRKNGDGTSNGRTGSAVGTSGTEIINNTFNIQGSNAKEIAQEVDRIMQVNIDRRRAKNGNLSF